MFFFKIAEIIISSQELSENNFESEKCSPPPLKSAEEKSILLEVLNESDEDKSPKMYKNSLLFNLLTRKSTSKEETRKIQLLSKLFTSKSYVEFPQYRSRQQQQAVKRHVIEQKDQVEPNLDPEGLIKKLKFPSQDHSFDGHSTTGLTRNYYQSPVDRLRQSEVLSTLQKISSLINGVNAENNPALMATPNAQQNIARIRTSISFLREKIFTSRLSSRDLNLLSNFIKMNTFGINEETLVTTPAPGPIGESQSTETTSQVIEEESTPSDPRNVSIESVIIKDEPLPTNPQQISVQLAKKTAQPIQARINEFLKQILEFVSKNYQSIKLTADGLNNNVIRNDSANLADDWIPILKLTWHRLLALSMAEQGTDLVIVDQINEYLPNLKRNTSGGDFTEMAAKDDFDIRDPLGELFASYYEDVDDEMTQQSGSEEKIPNRKFADSLLKCLNDLQGVSLQPQEYLLIRHAILFTAHEPSYLPSFALNLIKAVRSIRNINLDCDNLLASLNTLVSLCPKQTSALCCSHLVRSAALQRKVQQQQQQQQQNIKPKPDPCCEAKTEVYSSQLDYLLHNEAADASANICDHLKMKEQNNQHINPFVHLNPEEDVMKGDERVHRIEEFDDSCYCEKKVSILSSVLNKSYQSNPKSTVNSKLLFSKPQP